ncbi:MAG TPA: barstar family protein [Burkholderiales bacterium]|nr:barstar family protein [Burkholderiales bacterium]
MTVSGVYRTDHAPEGVQIDLGAKPVEAIARALQFPGWFGGNWDALEDCLSDLSWRTPPHRLILKNFRKGDELGILIDVLRSVAQFWMENGESFVAVFVDPGGELDLPPL